MSVLFLVITTVLIGATVFFLKWKYTYWKRKNVPFLTPRMLFGNVQNPCTRNISTAEEYKRFYNTIKSNGWKCAGVYSFLKPVFIPTDLELIKNILTKDFHKFNERGRYYNEEVDPISAHLFNIGGSVAADLRKKFTPSLSTAKLKSMFDYLLNCSDTLKNAVDEYHVSKTPVDIRRCTNNYTADVIGVCAYGIHFNTFGSSDSDVVLHYIQKFLKGNLAEAARMLFTFSFPTLSKFLKIRRYDKDATEFFTKFITDIIDQRQSNNVKKNDFLQTLIDLKNCNGVEVNGTRQTGITFQQLIAQAMIFFVAGYDSSASTVASVLYELSRNPEIQERVRTEINDVLENTEGNKLTHDSINELKYMQQVINETLRMHPPLAILNRQSSSSYKIPGSEEVLDKGTPLVIPLLGLHYDPDYFPKPDEFDPDRFSTENINKIKPFSYLPFGEGQKGCLGTRFGILMVKVALSVMLKNYRFTLNEKTQVPLKHDFGILNTVKGGIWLNVEELL